MPRSEHINIIFLYFLLFHTCFGPFFTTHEPEEMEERKKKWKKRNEKRTHSQHIRRYQAGLVNVVYFPINKKIQRLQIFKFQTELILFVKKKVKKSILKCLGTTLIKTISLSQQCALAIDIFRNTIAYIIWCRSF